ncbi:hypothetical protein D3C72_1140450 [compost metagenome]
MVAADKYNGHTGPFAAVEFLAQRFGLSPVRRTHAGNAEHVAVLRRTVIAPGAQAFFQFVELDHFIGHVGRDHFQATENRVGVAVDQAGHQGLALQIDDLGSRFDQGLDLCIAAHLQHFAVLHRQRLNLGLVAVGGEDLAV